MSRKILHVFLVVALSLWPHAVLAQQPAATDPEIVKGIRLVDDGDFDGAIFTLDSAVRRLAADPSHPADLPQAYLYLGIAFVGKGHEAAAKAKFREALKQIKDLSLSADKFPPKVINVFEAAREEMAKEPATAAGTTPTKPQAGAAPTKKGGGGKTLLIVGGVVAAGGIAAAASGGGGGTTTPTTPGGGGGLTTTSFPNEVVPFGGGKDYVIPVKGTGKLGARVAWIQDGVILDMYIVNLANPGRVLANGGRTGSKEVSLQLDVTPGNYRISVTNSTGNGPHVDTTFTLTVLHP